MMNGSHLTYDFNLFGIIKVIHMHYKKLKYHLKEKRFANPTPGGDHHEWFGVSLSGSVSLNLSVCLSHTQADSFTSMLISHLCGLTDGILAADS